MIARAQQLLVFLLLAAAALVGGYLASQGHVVLGLVTALFFLSAHVWLLALQFSLLALYGRARSGSATTRPTFGLILNAWFTEICQTPVVFFWRQPFRSRSIPDHLVTSHQTHGVVLVPGHFCNRAIWNPWLKRLGSDCIPSVAVTLKPPNGSIESLHAEISAAVAKIEALTGLPVILVAHSMGGLAVRSWLSRYQHPVRRIITLGTPHRGTWLARFSWSTQGKEMRRGSQFLRRLKHSERSLGTNALFTCFYSTCDNMVFPSRLACLSGARNVEILERPHLDILNDEAVYAEVLTWAALGAKSKPDATRR